MPTADPAPAYADIERAKLVRYYASVGEQMLAFVGERPLNLLRCPPGHSCYFQRREGHSKDGPFELPVRHLKVRQRDRKLENYLYVDSIDGLLACVERRAVEFHGWGSGIADIERPDRIAIDLDPGEDVPFATVAAAALELRGHLEALNLASFALLSGGKGVHVVVPLTPDAQWGEVRSFAKDFCTALATLAPDRFTVRIGKPERRGRIFLDFLRNQRGATAILPYSVRARTGAPVAAPVAWDELASLERSDSFTIADATLLVRRASWRRLRTWGVANQLLPKIGS